MKVSILTLFPDMFAGPFSHSIVKRAQENGHISISFIDIRAFGIGNHRMVDDTPYGGGIGMVMRVDVLHSAIQHAQKAAQVPRDKERIILMSAKGTPLKQATAKKLSQFEHLILICGHYEGVDERIAHYIDEEISVGDFVLTGGELPAMMVTDAVTRLLPGVLKDGAVDRETFSYTEGESLLLEYPHYTKPQHYDGFSVPEVLLSGNHKDIAQWKKEAARHKTQTVRPDLLKKTE